MIAVITEGSWGIRKEINERWPWSSHLFLGSRGVLAVELSPRDQAADLLSVEKQHCLCGFTACPGARESLDCEVAPLSEPVLFPRRGWAFGSDGCWRQMPLGPGPNFAPCKLCGFGQIL